MMTPEDQTYSYHFDGTGNTIAMTDSSKTIQNSYAYTPFGGLTQSESFHQPFTFSGEYGVMQEPNGLYYMRARYYDPQIGRFISEDPIRFAGGDVNLYAYAGNNPVNFVDPFGLAVGDWWDLQANFSRASEIADEELLRRPRDHNNLGDALRHAEWSMRTTAETNAFTAWFAGVGHEVKNILFDAQGPSETFMDLINNAEGRRAAMNNRPVDVNNLRASLNGTNGNYGSYNYGSYSPSSESYSYYGGSGSK
jgi:RHS repeat-associated protein